MPGAASRTAAFLVSLAATIGCASPAQDPPAGGTGGSPEGDGGSGEPPAADTTPVPDPRSTLHRDPRGRFTVEVPSSLVALPERDDLPARSPRLSDRVRFQSRQLLGTDVAELEPPALAIEIFASRPSSLRAWLEEHGWIGPRAQLEPARIEHAREALWLRDPAQLAPNENLWLAAGGWVYRLIPVGEPGRLALESFRLAASPLD